MPLHEGIALVLLLIFAKLDQEAVMTLPTKYDLHSRHTLDLLFRAAAEALPVEMKPVPAASYITRCVETVDLIARGFAMTHGLFPEPALIAREMSPFYMKDIASAVRRQQQVGHDPYLRLWLDGELPETEIMRPDESAKTLVNWLLLRLDELDDQEVSIGVTHDWNLFPVKEHFLGQPHEKVGQAGCLEGIVAYRRNGKAVLRGIIGDAVLL